MICPICKTEMRIQYTESGGHIYICKKCNHVENGTYK